MRTSHYLIVLILMAFIQCQKPAQTGDIEVIKERIIALNTGNGVFSEGIHKKNAIRELESQIQTILDKKTHVPELDSTKTGFENRVSAIFMQVQVLAKGYNTPEQRFYHSDELLKEIEKGLQHGEQFIKPGTPRPGNWYYWKIDAPRNLGPALIMMQDHIDRDLMKKMLTGMLDIMTEGPYLTGANGAMMGMNVIYYAVLTNDEKRLEQGLDLIKIEMSVTNVKTGILEDFSYQFHDQLLYTGGYGEYFTYNAALAMHLMSGTKFEIPKEEVDIFSKFIIEHVQWVLVEDKYDLSVRGRGVKSSPTVKPTAYLLLSNFSSEYQEQIRIITQRLLSCHKGSYDLNDAPFADLFPNPLNSPLHGFRYYPKSDYGLSRKPGFFVSVKMFSDKNMDYEILTGSNPGGHHRCNGFTYFSRNGNEIWQNTRNLDSDYDWEHLPGTTSRLERRPPNFANLSKSNFVGGAGTKENGIMAFHLIPVIDDFQAKKSYFMFSSGFISMGSDITSKKSGPHVSTTIAQWGTKDITVPLLLSDGEQITSTPTREIGNQEWAYCDSVGYIFNNCKNIKVRKDSLYATIFMNHGSHPQKAGYAYTVLPACRKEDILSYRNNPEVEILENSGRVHALKDKRSNATGIVFWEAGSFGMFSVDHPAIIYYQEKNEGISLTVSNPYYNSDTIKIAVSWKFDHYDLPESAVVTRENDKTIITLATANRRMYRIGLGRIKTSQFTLEDNLPYENFKIMKTENTPSSTYLTLRIPDIARDNHRLYIHYWQSYFQKELLPADITDTVAPGVYTYRWDNPGVVLRKHFNGDYNYQVRLRSGVHNAWDFFTVDR